MVSSLVVLGLWQQGHLDEEGLLLGHEEWKTCVGAAGREARKKTRR